MVFSRKSLILFSSFIWFSIGLFLISMGFRFLVQAIAAINEGVSDAYPLIQLLSYYFGGEEMTGILLIFLGCLLGYVKGRLVLRKAVARGVAHIRSLPERCSLLRMYPPRYYLLLGLMIGLGMLLKFLPNDIRGCLDIAIGFALIHGAFLYFHAASIFQKPAHP